MPRLVKKTPSYRLHKADGRAVVTLDGRDVYLGKYGSPESRAEYDRLIASWLVAGRRLPDADPGESAASVDELILAYWRHAEAYYRTPDGVASSELEKVRLAFRPLRRLFGHTPAGEFGPRALKAVRQAMIDAGLCRRTINQRVARVVRLFRFAVENEFVPPGVHQALKAVDGLRSGRSGAKEGRKVAPAPDERVDATRPFLSRQLRAVAELQRLTGMRSGEALAIRGCDLDTSGEVWEYAPGRHKTAHRGKIRRIFLGPRARDVLRPWLRPDPAEYLFQPREAEAERQAGRRSARRTPETPSQASRTRRAAPKKAAGCRYDTRSYAHAVARACDRAFPHPTLARVPASEMTADQAAELAAWRRAHRWHPHQLRHGAATRIRKECGLDAARVILGHSSPAVTEVYAEVDREKAIAVMNRVG